MQEKAKYSSYNGLSRVAMYWGVPLMAIVVVVLLSVVVAVIAAIFLGPGGILFAALGIPFLIHFRQMCETDDQALRINALEIWCRITRRNGKFFGNTYTLSPMQYGRRPHVYRRFFEKTTGK